MSPSADPAAAAAVRLEDVTEEILAQLLEVAIHDADADEVTPPLGGAPGWTAERIRWFREFHRAAAAGLDGPARQKTWAISCAGRLAGSIRLCRPGPGSLDAAGAGGLETGIWLGRSFRGQGIGREALRQVMAVTLAAGATALEAETTAGNRAAQALLTSAGAVLVVGEGAGAAVPVRARIALG